MQSLLLASSNPGKIHEIRSLLENLSLILVTPTSLGKHLQVAEDGSNYAENASRKAIAYTRATGLMTLADDSGLEVDALGGLPGLHSARFSPLPHATDADRRQHLLSMLWDHPRPWLAHFHCTVALATPGGEVYFAVGDCPGEIIPQELGQHGFGYDPIFMIPALGKTMAELTTAEKNTLSHRALAVKGLRPILLQLLTA